MTQKDYTEKARELHLFDYGIDYGKESDFVKRADIRGHFYEAIQSFAAEVRAETMEEDAVFVEKSFQPFCKILASQIRSKIQL